MARFLHILRFPKAVALALCLALLPLGALAQPLEKEIPLTLTAPSALLMEAETGAVIFEKAADARRPAASITKLMTVLLVMEAMEEGRFREDTMVTVSPHAAGQTGSQAFLDAYEAYPLSELLKATIMASGNDSAVALAELTGGTEENFVALMNARAEKMGLQNTRYVNCTGLPAAGQYTSARDVALISREIVKHPLYLEKAAVWLGELIHPSGRKTELTNTNRLVRFYKDCDGLKTGSTNEAKYCLSATAERKGTRLIAVVLGVPNSQTRFDEARAMMDYGFATYTRVQVAGKGDWIGAQVPVQMGARDQVEAALGAGLSMLLRNGQREKLTMEVELLDQVPAPVQKGQPLGSVVLLLEGRAVARLPAVAAEDVGLPGFLDGLLRILKNWQPGQEKRSGEKKPQQEEPLHPKPLPPNVT